MSRKRILVHVTSKGDDGCSWYRGIGPWSHLGRDFNDQVEVCFFRTGGEPPWADMRMAHAVFLLRPYTKDELAIARVAKKLGIPLWVDWDDHLFGLTPDNPARVVYNSSEVQSRMLEILLLANVVTVTTQALKNVIAQHEVKNCQVIPNSYDPYFDKIRQPIKRSKATQILYRGSPTHQRDLALANEAIVIADRDFQPAWFFIGMEPWESNQLKNKTFISHRGVFDYLEILGWLSADIGMVPLVDTPFNRCKSNIAAMELAIAGAVPVVPTWEEWDIPGVWPYETGEFAEVLLDLIDIRHCDQEALEKRRQQTLDFFKQTLHLDTANRRRLEILNTL